MPSFAHADGIVDSLNLAPFVPLVLDALMTVGTSVYEYFVVGKDGNSLGIIHILIWAFFGISVVIDLIKMYLPKEWVGFLGFSGGGELASGSLTAEKILSNFLKTVVRVLIATTILLQLKPIDMTRWLINPFLEFGSIYTTHIIKNIHDINTSGNNIKCPQNIVSKEWISEKSCDFLIQPVSDLSYANNQIINRGFRFRSNGLRGLLTPFPRGGQDFMNIITGIILIMTFVSSNVFMALLVIQGIFNFGMQIILYPFNVLAYVFKKNDKLFDIWPAFAGLTQALQQLIVTMIACAFILCINIAVVKALFQWNQSVFNPAAGGEAISIVPQPESAIGTFGQHSVLWLSSILTFYLMFKIFELTRQQLEKYVGKGMDSLYNTTVNDTKNLYSGAKGMIKTYKDGIDWFKK
jgi:hypothetical protein